MIVLVCIHSFLRFRASVCLSQKAFSLQGYPGNLTATVTYLLTAANEMQVTMEATTDAATPVNLAQHTYFNLNGVEDTTSTILNHNAQINA